MPNAIRSIRLLLARLVRWLVWMMRWILLAHVTRSLMHIARANPGRAHHRAARSKKRSNHKNQGRKPRCRIGFLLHLFKAYHSLKLHA